MVAEFIKPQGKSIKNFFKNILKNFIRSSYFEANTVQSHETFIQRKLKEYVG